MMYWVEIYVIGNDVPHEGIMDEDQIKIMVSSLENPNRSFDFHEEGNHLLIPVRNIVQVKYGKKPQNGTT